MPVASGHRHGLVAIAAHERREHTGVDRLGHERHGPVAHHRRRSFGMEREGIVVVVHVYDRAARLLRLVLRRPAESPGVPGDVPVAIEGVQDGGPAGGRGR